MTSTSTPAHPAPDVAALRTALAGAARRLGASGLVVGSGGNASVRAGDLVAVTGTGVRLAAATPDDVTVLTLDGAPVEGRLAPTSEVALHLGVHRSEAARAAGVHAVVHTHAPASTALGTVATELPVLHYAQLSLGGALRVAPFEVFGTPELAHAVGAALDGRLAALMAHHGAVALGRDLDQAVEHAELMEWLCEVHTRAVALGQPRPLTAEQQRAVVAHATRTGYGQP